MLLSFRLSSNMISRDLSVLPSLIKIISHFLSTYCITSPRRLCNSASDSCSLNTGTTIEIMKCSLSNRCLARSAPGAYGYHAEEARGSDCTYTCSQVQASRAERKSHHMPPSGHHNAPEDIIGPE